MKAGTVVIFEGEEYQVIYMYSSGMVEIQQTKKQLPIQEVKLVNETELTKRYQVPS